MDPDTKRLFHRVAALEPADKLIAAAELLRRNMSKDLALSLIRAAESEVALEILNDKDRSPTKT
jgi:hypothetical protein